MDRILVCGCARSGNNLMAFLLSTGFKGTYKTRGECSPFIKKGVPSPRPKWIVGSLPKLAKNLHRILSERDSFFVVYMMRDPRAVLACKHPNSSRRFYVHPRRWVRTAKEYFLIANGKQSDRIILIKFEDLLISPNSVQESIMKRIDIKRLRSFSKCYSFFRKTGDNKTLKTMWGARPLDVSRIDGWRFDPEAVIHVNAQLRKYPIIERLMKKLGYI